jgi:hypothetical protein
MADRRHVERRHVPVSFGHYMLQAVASLKGSLHFYLIVIVPFMPLSAKSGTDQV